MENFPNDQKDYLYYKIPSSIPLNTDALFVNYIDFNNLQNENKELKNRIIELQKDITFLRTLIFKQNKKILNKINKI